MEQKEHGTDVVHVGNGEEELVVEHALSIANDTEGLSTANANDGTGDLPLVNETGEVERFKHSAKYLQATILKNGIVNLWEYRRSKFAETARVLNLNGCATEVHQTSDAKNVKLYGHLQHDGQDTEIMITIQIVRRQGDGNRLVCDFEGTGFGVFGEVELEFKVTGSLHRKNKTYYSSTYSGHLDLEQTSAGARSEVQVPDLSAWTRGISHLREIWQILEATTQKGMDFEVKMLYDAMRGYPGRMVRCARKKAQCQENQSDIANCPKGAGIYPPIAEEAKVQDSVKNKQKRYWPKVEFVEFGRTTDGALRVLWKLNRVAGDPDVNIELNVKVRFRLIRNNAFFGNGSYTLGVVENEDFSLGAIYEFVFTREDVLKKNLVAETSFQLHAEITSASSNIRRLRGRMLSVKDVTICQDATLALKSNPVMTFHFVEGKYCAVLNFQTERKGDITLILEHSDSDRQNASWKPIFVRKITVQKANVIPMFQNLPPTGFVRLKLLAHVHGTTTSFPQLPFDSFGQLKAETWVSTGKDVYAECMQSRECPICYEEYVVASTDGRSIIQGHHVLPNEVSIPRSCGHLFHASCLCDWAKISRQCPICRKGFTAISFPSINHDTDKLIMTKMLRLGSFVAVSALSIRSTNQTTQQND